MKTATMLAVGFCLVPLMAWAAAGHIAYTLEKAAAPTADQLDAYARIEKAMDSALGYYNALTTIRKTIKVQYDASVPTADASSNGTLRFGSTRSYMYVGTAMHEIAHTVGVGTTSEYKALMVNGVFTGAHATSTLRAITGDSTAVLKGDSQHIWPYGLNYASEVKSTTDLVNHCRIIESLYQDLFHESVVFTGRIRSKSTGQCMYRAGTALFVGVCTDSNSLVRLVAMGDSSPTFRVEFGDRVIDAPNQSSTVGLKLGLYAWNRGANQQIRIDGDLASPGTSLRLRMVHSSLFLEASGTDILQNPSTAESSAQNWELAADTPASKATNRMPNSAIQKDRIRHDASGRIRHQNSPPWSTVEY